MDGIGMISSSLGARTGAVVASAFLAATFLSGCSARPRPDAPEPATVQAVEAAPAPPTLTRTLDGQVASILTAEIRPQIGGIVQRRLFAEGGDVRAGEVLFTIDDRLYASALAEAQAQLESARASQVAAIAKARRFATLENTNAAPEQDVDDARTAARQAMALVHEREAALTTARTNLDYTRIRAPIAGRIGRSQITVGALVTPGQTAPLATVQAIDTVFADLALPLTGGAGAAGGGAARPAPGALVRIFAGGDRDHPLAGRVAFTDATVAQPTQTTIVRVRVGNPGHRLLPGMFVAGAVQEAAPPAATVVPQQAVTVDNGDRGSVLVVGPRNRAVRRVVTLGPTLGGAWIIAAGLSRGERVIVAGGTKVAPGDAVRPRLSAAPGVEP